MSRAERQSRRAGRRAIVAFTASLATGASSIMIAHAPQAAAVESQNPVVDCAIPENTVYRRAMSSTRLQAYYNGFNENQTEVSFQGLFQAGVTPMDLYGGRYNIVVDPRIAPYVKNVEIAGYGGVKQATQVKNFGSPAEQADSTTGIWRLPILAVTRDEFGNHGFLSQTWIGDNPNYFYPKIVFDRTWPEVMEAAGLDPASAAPAKIAFDAQFSPRKSSTGDFASNFGNETFLPWSVTQRQDGPDNFVNATALEFDPATGYDSDTKTLTMDGFILALQTYALSVGNKPYQLVVMMDPKVAQRLDSVKLREWGLGGKMIDVPVTEDTLNPQTGELIINVFGHKEGWDGVYRGKGIVNSGAKEIFSRHWTASWPRTGPTKIQLTFKDDLYSLIPQNSEGLNAGQIDLPFAWEFRSYSERRPDKPAVQDSSAYVSVPLRDSDGDKIPDRYELNEEVGTNPCNSDTDGDGRDDGYEVKEGSTDPLIAPPTLKAFSVAEKELTAGEGNLIGLTDFTQKQLAGRRIELQKQDGDQWVKLTDVTVGDDGNFTLPTTGVADNDVVRVAIYTPEISRGDEVIQRSYTNPEVSEPVTVGALASSTIEPKYVDNASGKQGEEITVPAPTFVEQDNPDTEVARPEKVSFALADDNSAVEEAKRLPADVQVEVKEDGSLTITSGTNTQKGDYQVPVEVTYADGSKDVVLVPVTVTDGTAPTVNDLKTPELTAGEALTDNTVVLGTVADETTNAGDLTLDVAGLPTGVEAAIDPETGNIVLTGTPEGVDAKTNYPVKITVTDKAGNETVVETSVTVAPAVTLAEKTQVTYPEDQTVAQDGSVQVTPEFANAEGEKINLPENTKFSVDQESLPEGVTAAVDENGVVTVNAGPGAKPGAVEVPVTVRYSDGSSETVTVTVEVVDESKPVVDDVKEASLTAGIEVPANTVIARVTDNSTSPENLNVKVEGLPKGVEASVDPETGNVVLTGTPEAVDQATDYEVTITVTDESGNETVSTTKVSVAPAVTLAEKTAVSYPEDKTVAQDGSVEVTPEFADSEGEKIDLPENTKFSVNQQNLPEGVTATVDENGVVTVKAAPGAKPGEVEVPVTVTYSDESSEVVTVKVAVVDESAPRIEDTAEASLTAGAEVPANTVIARVTDNSTSPENLNVKVEGLPKGVEATVNENGEVVLSGTPDAVDQATDYEVTITVTDESGNETVSTTKVSVAPAVTLAEKTQVTYPEDKTVAQDGSVQVTPEFANAEGEKIQLPADTQFSVDQENLPEGVTATVDENGVVTVNAAAGAKPGDVEVPVTVRYSDDSSEVVTVKVSVVDESKPEINNVEGASLTAGTQVPENTVIARVTDNSTSPENLNVKVEGLPKGVEASVDPETGNVVLTGTPETVAELTDYDVTITVTDEAGNKTVSNTKVSVAPAVTLAEKTTVEYPSGKTVAQDGSVEVTPEFTNVDGETIELPADTQFSVGEDNLPEGVTASVDENGVVTVKAAPGTEPGAVEVPVEVRYSDGSSETVTVSVEVVDESKPVVDDVKEASLTAGTEVPANTVIARVTDNSTSPENLNVKVEGLPEGVKATFNENGEVVLSGTPDAVDKATDFDMTITVTDEAGNKTVSNTKVSVAPAVTLAEKTVVTYPEDKTVAQDGSVEVTPEFTDSEGEKIDLPENTKFSVDQENLPEGVTASVDENGVVTVKAAPGAKPGAVEVPVEVRYSDGSSETVTVSVEVVDESKPVVDDVKEASLTAGAEVPANTVIARVTDNSTSPENLNVKVEGLPKGVEATVNENGEVVLSGTPDAVDKATDFDVTITVTDEAGNKTVSNTKVSVAPAVTLAEKTTVEYPSGKTVAQDGSVEVTPEFTDVDGETIELPAGTEFTVGEDNLPEGVTASVDENGVVTVNAAAGAKPGDVEVPVTVRYSDDSSEVVTVKVSVVDEAKPVVDDVKEASLTAGAEVPANTVIARVTDNSTDPADLNVVVEGLPKGVKATVNDNGEVVLSGTPEAVAEDTSYPVTITVTDKAGNQTVVETAVTVSPAVTIADKTDVTYPAESVEAGDKITLQPTVTNADGEPVAVPEETVFSVNDTDLPEGVHVEIDPATGELVVTVDDDAAAGSVTVPVIVRYPDGSEDTVFVTVDVKGKTDSTDPTVSQVSTPALTAGEDLAGKNVVLAKVADDATDAADLSVQVDGLPEGVGFAVNDKGEVVLTGSPADVAEATDYPITVTVTDKAGNSTVVTTVVTVSPAEQPAPAEPADQVDPTVTAAEGLSLTGGSPIPDDTVLAIVGDNSTPVADLDVTVEGLPSGVSAVVDPVTGAIVLTGTPAEVSETTTYPVTVTVTDKAGNTVTTVVDVTVDPAPVKEAEVAEPVVPEPVGGAAPTEVEEPAETVETDVPVADADSTTVSYPLTPVEVGEATAITPKIVDADTGEVKDLPSGTTVSIDTSGLPKGITATVDPVTGVVTVVVDADYVAGDNDRLVIPVTVTYPDGSVDTASVTVGVYEVGPVLIVDDTDTDGDGIADAQDPDADGDGVNNSDEKAAGLNPLLPDSDGDGVADGDEDLDDDHLKNRDESAVAPGAVDVAVDGLAEPGITDLDGDGVADLIDASETKAQEEEEKTSGSSTKRTESMTSGIVPLLIGAGVLAAVAGLLATQPEAVASFSTGVVPPVADNQQQAEAPVQEAPHAGAAANQGMLAVTGANTTGVGLAGLLAMVFGSLLAFARRRRGE